ncbi:MAG: exodeoxyribonuclease III [Pseudomonadota bacterium]
MRVVTVSVNGLREAISRGFFEWLADQDADVVALQDHRVRLAEIEDDPSLTPAGYQAWFMDAEDPETGGVGFYTRFFPKAIIYGFNYGPADTQGRYLQADFQNVSVASVLAPPAADAGGEKARDDFMEAFLTHTGKTARKRRQYIVCANLQTAHRDEDADSFFHRQPVSGFLPHERAWMDELFNQQGYLDAYRSVADAGSAATWWPEWAKNWRRVAGWRTDYQMVTPGLHDAVEDGWIDTDAGFSDHAPVVVDYDVSPE